MVEKELRKKEGEAKGIRRKKFFQCQRERAVRARSARDVRADEEKKCYRSQSVCASSEAAVEGLFSRLMLIISAKPLTIIILTQNP